MASLPQLDAAIRSLSDCEALSLHGIWPMAELLDILDRRRNLTSLDIAGITSFNALLKSSTAQRLQRWNVYGGSLPPQPVPEEDFLLGKDCVTVNMKNRVLLSGTLKRLLDEWRKGEKHISHHKYRLERREELFSLELLQLLV